MPTYEEHIEGLTQIDITATSSPSTDDLTEILKNAVIELGYENKSGSILYSGNETLRKGNFYFLGANPGGHSDQSNSKYPDTILNQVLRKNSYPSFNEYFDGKWKRSGSRSSLPGSLDMSMNRLRQSSL